MRCSLFIFLGFAGCAAAAEVPTTFSIQPILRVYYDVVSSRGSPTTSSYSEGLSYLRFGARGGYGPDLTYMLQFEARDFVRDRGNLALRYCVLQWQATKTATLEFGQTDEPFGLESYTQVRNLTFLERGLPFAFAPSYHTGVSWRQRMGDFAWHAGVFGDTLGAGPNDDGRGSSLRFTYDPQIAGFSATHVGFSVARREYATHSVRFRSRSESQLFPLVLADTRTITQVDHSTTAAIEGLCTVAGFTLVGEATGCRVERTNGLPDLDFSGAYVAVSRYLTGELKNYVNPKCCTVSGFSREELVGRAVRTLRSEETPPEVYRDLWSTVADDRVWNGEFYSIKKNGENYLENVVAAPLVGKDGRPRHIVTLKDDITARKRSEAELAKERELSQMKSQFAIGEIVGNALVFSPPGSAVTVTGSNREGRYRIEITDQGPGLTAEQRVRIGPFTQFERQKREQQGLGLGLAIARATAQLAGGSLTLESGADSRGLRVVFDLPLADD